MPGKGFRFKALLTFVVALLAGCKPAAVEKHTVNLNPAGHEDVLYHVLVRSFFDSNGDEHGDLRGLTEKLDYLQSLGVTGVLLLPLYPSPFHHNYFADSFGGIDPEYGTLDDFRALAQALHQRGMTLFMDTEVQYTTEHHPWYQGAINGDPAFRDHILFDEDGDTPSSVIFDLTHLRAHSGENIRLGTVNLNAPAVRQKLQQYFAFWLDPDGNGDTSDGVDGFRIDHMMDDLDDKGRLTNLYTAFWAPLFDALRKLNPDVRIVAEQADWRDTGHGYFAKAGTDAVFGFELREAHMRFDKARIEDAYSRLSAATPASRAQWVFLENHDVPRIATVLHRNQARLKAAAAMSLLGSGVPLIYYGQELGMPGLAGVGKELVDVAPGDPIRDELSFGEKVALMDKLKREGANDGADIPIRRAFEWYQSADSNKPGTALWYKGIAPWWPANRPTDSDGVSLEEQQGNPDSLWSTYQQLIASRRSSKALSIGSQTLLTDAHPQVLTYLREHENERVLVAINLSSDAQQLTLSADLLGDTLPAGVLALYATGSNTELSSSGITLHLAPFGFGAFALQPDF